ncbi:hypothetical protein L7F22_057425 [Adiantum nelumboides]|nr:hypothetical protein [Adiantum nelumboides]
MLSCFPCGRSSSVIEPSPHKLISSFQETKYSNDVNIGHPLISSHLIVSSAGRDAKKRDLYKSLRSLNIIMARSDSTSQDDTSEIGASDCPTVQKEIVISSMVLKEKHTEEHADCTTREDVKLAKDSVDNAKLLGSDEEICKEVRQQSCMQDEFSKKAAMDGENKFLSCSSQMTADNTVPGYYQDISKTAACTETIAHAPGENSSAAIAEEEGGVVKRDVSVKELKPQSLKAHGKRKKHSLLSKLDDVGYQTDKRSLKSYKPEEPTHLFSYGISDQQRDFLFLCAGLVIQAVGFQLKSIVEVVTTIILLGYRAYFFASNVADSLSHIKERLRETRTKLLSYILPKEQGRSLGLQMEKLEKIKPLLIAVAKRMGSGCVTAAFVLALLAALLFISLFLSYFAVLKGSSTQKPIHITKQLYFDYTKSHPVASLDLLSLNIYPKGNVSKSIKANHKTSFRYRGTLFLTIPESNYNRNLGVFQVTSELLSDTGDVLAKASLPSMLHFKSNILHNVRSISLAIPLLAGVASETQTLRLPLLDWQQDMASSKRSSMLRISLVPRAGRGSSDGLPELYRAEIQIDSYWMSSSTSASGIRILVMWIGLSSLLFGFMSSFCMYKIHQKRSIT